ncbi:hypothetical protein BYT27DRAFT_7171823 [Phlegmacium glaucopus]|nr:hypothetical protein BYT27DRAFT_7171823 [Phlegmacium glaucopus]
MPRRTRTRLSSHNPKNSAPSRRSRSKNTSQFDDDQDPPSEERWATMAPYGSFVVNDADGEEHVFSKEDLAIVVPMGRNPQGDTELSEYWVAKIKDIRAIVYDENSNAVWARVQWFYSGKDVSDVVKSFDRNIIDKYERIFSDHYDFVVPEAFNGLITVAKFREDDPEQPYIPPHKFYRRYTLEYKARRIQPKPGSSTCICSTPYVPGDVDPSKLMHFCPRPSCRIAYHDKCLLNIKSQDSSPVAGPSSPRPPARSARKHASAIYVNRPQRAVNGNAPTTEAQSQPRALRLLACSPDTDDELELESLIPVTLAENSHSEPAKKKRRGRHSKNIPPLPTEDALQQPRTLTDVLSTLPPDLLKVAQQPLVRGGAFALGGVAGNIGAVTRARRMVYQALEGGEVPEDWEIMLFGEDTDATVDNAIVKLRGGKTISPLLCPKCKSAI